MQQLVEQIAGAVRNGKWVWARRATTTGSLMRPEGESQAAPLRVMLGHGDFRTCREWPRVGLGRTSSRSAGLTP